MGDNMQSVVLPEYSRYEILATGVIKYRATGKICPDWGDGAMTARRGRGYRKIKLYDDQGIRRLFSVHRLMWRAFFGEIPANFDVDHIDFDRGNNNINNLRIIPSHLNQLRKKTKVKEVDEPVGQKEFIFKG